MIDAMDETPQLPRGRRLGVDVGQARVGVAVSDPDGLLATPVETIVRRDHNDGGLMKLSQLSREYDVQVVYIGLPKHLSGAEGEATSAVRSFARNFNALVNDIELRLVDERLTTVSAHRALREAGKSTKRHRPVIDQQAAVEILQTALDLEKVRGSRVGEAFGLATPADSHHNLEDA